jgi:glyoxylate carboligase
MRSGIASDANEALELFVAVAREFKEVLELLLDETPANRGV